MCLAKRQGAGLRCSYGCLWPTDGFAVLIGCLSIAPTRKVISGLTWKRLRAESQHVAIGIFDVKLQRPSEIGEGHANGDASCDQLIVQLGGVLDADPDPCGTTSLAAAAQIDAGAIAVHGRKVLGAPTRVLKSQLVNVEGERGLHVLHSQDRRAAFEVDVG